MNKIIIFYNILFILFCVTINACNGKQVILSMTKHEQPAKTTERLISSSEKNTFEIKELTKSRPVFTSGWKIYNNKRYGFELRYPNDLASEESFDQQDSLQMIDVNLSDKEQGERIFYVRVTDIGWKNFMPIYPNSRIVDNSKSNILIDGIVASLVKVKDIEASYLWIKKSGMLYEFTGKGETFDRILSTFKFIKAIKPEQKWIPFTRPVVELLPLKIKEWISNSLKLDVAPFVDCKELDGKQYLLITSGQKLTGGHIVDIFDVSIIKHVEVIVKVKFTHTTEEQPATQITARPYDLVCIEATGLPARFVPENDGKHISITTYTGIDHLPTIVAQSRGIKVFTPEANKEVGRKFSVSGIALVFEATILYRLFNTKRDKLADGYITATAQAPSFKSAPVIPTSSINWKYFIFSVVVPKPIIADKGLVLELYTMDIEHGMETNLVALPLKFKLGKQ